MVYIILSVEVKFNPSSTRLQFKRFLLPHGWRQNHGVNIKSEYDSLIGNSKLYIQSENVHYLLC